MIWFQQHKAEFTDLTTLKNMFLAGYNPWGKTKREQLQSWNNLSFDPQKTDIDEQVDLVLMLGNMLQQDKQAKMEIFIETIPTIIQTHLIIEPNWAEVTKQAKNLEHIIQRCNPLAIAPSIIQDAGAVPSLYLHIAQSQDQILDNIPKPFKSTKSGGKSKPQQQPQPPILPQKKKNIMKRQTTITIMRIIEVITEAANPTGINKGAENLIEDPNRGEGDNKSITGANTKATVDNLTPPAEAITIIITTVIIKAEVDVAIVVIITEVTAMDEAIIEAITITNTTNITHILMAHRWSNMAHHVHFVVTLTTPKHCFKGEHDINNPMEKMSLSSNNQHQNGLYQ